MEFIVKEREEFTIVEFSIEEVIAPEELSALVPPAVNGEKGVILSGRGPIWLYCYLVHYYHPTRFVATYDPRLGGAVVVESHTKDYKVGQIIPLNLSS